MTVLNKNLDEIRFLNEKLRDYLSLNLILNSSITVTYSLTQ